MKNNGEKYKYVILFVLFIVIFILSDKNKITWWTGLVSVIQSIVAAYVVTLTDNILIGMPIYRFKYSIIVDSIFRFNKIIRVSMAYLFVIRIEVKGIEKYVVIRGENKDNQIQPIGGAYKYYESSESEIRNLILEKDIGTRSNIKDDTLRDLRLKMKFHNFSKFIKWFDSGLGREWNVLRELKEELVDTSLIENDSLNFENIQIEKIDSYDNYYGYKEECGYYLFRHFDIFELKFSDLEKKKLTEILEQDNHCEDYKLYTITSEQIVNGDKNTYVEIENEKLLFSDNMIFLLQQEDKRELHKKNIFYERKNLNRNKPE